MLKKIMQKANAKKKDQKGFTLIELLAVIVILAILAAIAIPSIISIINKQNDKAQVQDAITVIHAAKLYVADNTSSFGESNTLDLKTGELAQYLEKSVAKSIGDGYTVTVTKSGSNYSYSISDANLPSGNSKSATEDQLINYNKSGSSLPN